jgi:hypothetical protein
MTPYKNLSGKSGVVAYELGTDSINIEFVGGAVYRYDYDHAGRDAIQAMKMLAEAGEGLSTFISQQVGDAYAEKLR